MIFCCLLSLVPTSRDDVGTMCLFIISLLGVIYHPHPRKEKRRLTSLPAAALRTERTMAKPFERQSADLRHEEAAVNRAYGWELSLNSLDHYVPRQNLQPMKRARTANCSYVVIGRLFGRVLTCAGLRAFC